MTKPKMAEAAEKLIVALNDLQGAQFAYDEAAAQSSAASRHQTEAVNKLNEAQKQVDKLMADVRATGSGDWASNRRAGKGCFHNAQEN